MAEDHGEPISQPPNRSCDTVSQDGRDWHGRFTWEQLDQTGKPKGLKARKHLNIKVLFRERMKREGRWQEYLAVLSDVRADLKTTSQAADWEAMRRMGYQSPHFERKKYRRHQALIWKATAFVEAESLKRAAEEMKRLELETVEQEQAKIDFETAFIGLPNVAGDRVEWEWIGSHPAMLRLNRSTEKLKSILLTGQDIAEAPSKRAVIQLQEWVNAPRKFCEALIGVQKKENKGDSSSSAGHGDEDLSVVEEMLNNLKKDRK